MYKLLHKCGHTFLPLFQIIWKLMIFQSLIWSNISGFILANLYWPLSGNYLVKSIKSGISLFLNSTDKIYFVHALCGYPYVTINAPIYFRLAVDYLLLRQVNLLVEFPFCYHIQGFSHCHSCKSITRTTFPLIFDRTQCAFDIPPVPRFIFFQSKHPELIDWSKVFRSRFYAPR